jgi:hypothetical protein
MRTKCTQIAQAIDRIHLAAAGIDECRFESKVVAVEPAEQGDPSASSLSLWERVRVRV